MLIPSKKYIKTKPEKVVTITPDTMSSLLLLIVSGVFITPLIVNSELHDPTRTGKIFFFVRYMLLIIPVGLFAFMRNNWKQAVDKLSLLVMAWGGWIILRGKFGGIWHDEKFIWFSGCFVFFFLTVAILTTILQKGQIKLLLIPVFIIVLVAAIEAVLGLLQLYGGFRVYHGIFKVTGTFFNPAPYAGFLLGSVPWALELTSLKKQNTADKIIYWCGFVAMLLIIVIIPSARSRAAYLGLVVSTLVWLYYRYKPLLYLKCILNTKLKRKLVYILVPTTLFLLLTGLYWIKKDSADGRLLIWKVALETVKEKPITGHGFNTAQATLTPAQAAYFAAGKGSESEKMLAGSVRWTFNEPLQAASETGLPGMLLLLLVTGYALFYKLPHSISRKRYLLAGAARASLAGITVFGCFSYPFYSLPVTLLFFYALAVLAAIKEETIKIQRQYALAAFKISVVAGALLLATLYLLQTSKLKNGYWLWDEAEQLYQMGVYTEADESFAEALPVLQHNGLFLQQYAKCLAMENRHKEALNLLHKSGHYYNDEFSAIALGDVYKALNQNDEAEKQYQQAASMVPHKFYPLYLLARLYNQTGQQEKAVILARQILNKAVKVPSTAIEEIKAEMQKIIDKQASLQSSNELLGKGQEANRANNVLPARHPSN